MTISETALDSAPSPVGPEEDLRLAARCASGERAAQRELFRTYRTRVYATLYRIMGSNREMEDLIQDVFLQVFRSLGNYRGDSRLVTWISRITTRVAFAHLSRRGPSQAPLEAVPDPVAPDPDAERQVAAREALRRLYGVLDRIEPKLRIAFTLHVIDGRSIRDIADATNSSQTAVKTRIWRARKEIAKRADKDPWLARYSNSKEQGT